MDFDTLITTVYVIVDDWYKAEMAETMRRKTGPRARMSDSEVLTVALLGQWRVGVPWKSERGLVRYMLKYGRGWFPTMLERSAYNERVRNLWAVFIQLQQALATQLRHVTDCYEVVDCVPLPACSISQTQTYDGHWLWWSTKGYGGTHGGWYWGDQALVSVLPTGVITGWLIAAANSDDRWSLQALISYRAGQGAIRGPVPKQADRVSQPPSHIGPALAAGGRPGQIYLADQGFNGWRWSDFWRQTYACQVIAPPVAHAQPTWSRPWRRWLAAKRQIVETTFALLCRVFDFQHLGAHSRWGLYTRVAITTAAFNLGILLNRLFNRSGLTHETLLC